MKIIIRKLSLASESNNPPRPRLGDYSVKVTPVLLLLNQSSILLVIAKVELSLPTENDYFTIIQLRFCCLKRCVNNVK